MTNDEYKYSEIWEKHISNATIDDLRAPMARKIRQLFDAAPKLETIAGIPDQEQRPAMLCNVVLRGLPQPMSGVLSITDEGLLKLLTPIERAGELPVLLEQFFSYADVMIIAIQHAPQAKTASSLWSPS